MYIDELNATKQYLPANSSVLWILLMYNYTYILYNFTIYNHTIYNYTTIMFSFRFHLELR